MAVITQAVPPLVAGDKLTREEFLRRWEGQPNVKRAELIGGIVYMPSPVSIDHGDFETDTGYLLRHYMRFTPGVRTASNATLLMLDDAPQADVHLRILPEYGGQTRVKGRFVAGAPELIAEVCVTSTAYDLHQKLELYEAAGVCEYLAVLCYERAIRWHRLGQHGYEVIPPDHTGISRSQAFPGLWVAGQALLEERFEDAMTTLEEGLRSQEHQDFVAQLAARKSDQSKRRSRSTPRNPRPKHK